MKTIKQEYKICSKIDRVWEALTNPKEIEAWGAGSAKMDDKVGTKFKLWGGDIHGTNTKVVKNKVLEQDWYGGDWPQPSKVTFTLSEESGPLRSRSEARKIKVVLVHENVPDEEAGNIDEGWKDYYLGPLKDYLEK